MESITRWGILSTANIGRRAMVPALIESPLAMVSAVASRAEEKAQAFADELDIPRAYGSYEALLEDPEIDAIYNPLPNHLHCEWTIRAAEAGKHTLCEKPLALNTTECEQMIAAARANGVQLMEAFMYRYHPRVLAARQMLLAGVIGELRTIETAFTYRSEDFTNIRFQPEMGGGALMDIGCYCINISRVMAGREPKNAQARAYWTNKGVDDQLTAILDFGDGLMAHFDCAMNQERRQGCILAGSHGYLELPLVFNPGLDETLIYVETGDDTPQAHTFSAANVYRLLAEEFMQTIAGQPPVFSIDESLGNMRVIEALLKSARDNGHPVVV